MNNFYDEVTFFPAMVYMSIYKSWYFNPPLHKNLLGEFLNKAANILQNSSSACTCRSKISNHSAPKTSICNLLNNNVNHVYVSQLSGHKPAESVKSYQSVYNKNKCQI